MLAQGLEYDAVFIVGAEQKAIDTEKPVRYPVMHPMCTHSAPTLHPCTTHCAPTHPRAPAQEERRCFYVAATRAKRHLRVSAAAERNTYGRTEVREPSGILAEMVARNAFGKVIGRPLSQVEKEQRELGACGGCRAEDASGKAAACLGSAARCFSPAPVSPLCPSAPHSPARSPAYSLAHSLACPPARPLASRAVV